MIDLGSLPYFPECGTTLREASRDFAHGESMTNSELPAFDFDKVKRNYANGLSLSEETATSCDAVFSLRGRTVLVEFKNGKHRQSINRSLKDKIRDSLLIFCDLARLCISETREELVFILVYHEDLLEKDRSRTRIGSELTKLGKQELILFDLEKFQRLYFKEVHTYTREEFERYIYSEPAVLNR